MIKVIHEEELATNGFVTKLLLFVRADYPHEACQLDGAFFTLCEFYSQTPEKSSCSNDKGETTFTFKLEHLQANDLKQVIARLNEENSK